MSSHETRHLAGVLHGQLLLRTVNHSGLALTLLDGVNAGLARGRQLAGDHGGDELGVLLGRTLTLDVAESACALDLLEGSHAVAADAEPHGTSTLDLVGRALANHEGHVLGVLLGDVLLLLVHHSSASLLLLELDVVDGVVGLSDESSNLTGELLSFRVGDTSLALEFLQLVEFREVAWVEG